MCTLLQFHLNQISQRAYSASLRYTFARDCSSFPSEYPMPQPIPSFVSDELDRLGLEVDPVTLDKLAEYLDALLEANKQFNLTAIREPEAAWRRHIIDSLTILPCVDDLPEHARVIDIGSGGGLPGIPLAIARPDLNITLLESTGKKAAFLQYCAAELGLSNITVVHERAERAGQDPDYRSQYDLAVCRAIGQMGELLEYALPFLKIQGRLLAMKGPRAEEELQTAGDALTLLGAGEVQVIEAYPEDFELNTVIVMVTKQGPTPPEYPRLPGVPHQTPL